MKKKEPYDENSTTNVDKINLLKETIKGLEKSYGKGILMRLGDDPIQEKSGSCFYGINWS